MLPLNKAMQRSRFLYIEICFKRVLQALLKAPRPSRCHQAPWNWTDLSITRLDDMGQTISFIRAQRVPLPVLHFCFFGCFLMNFSTCGSCGALMRRKGGALWCQQPMSTRGLLGFWDFALFWWNRTENCSSEDVARSEDSHTDTFTSPVVLPCFDPALTWRRPSRSPAERTYVTLINCIPASFVCTDCSCKPHKATPPSTCRGCDERIRHSRLHKCD